MEFAPFTAKDFDAYLPKKWESNLFNLERLEVKQKLLALGRVISPAMRAEDGSPLECEVSVEHPALWNQRRVANQRLFFSRNKEARKELEGIIASSRTMAAHIQDPSPLRNHIFLSLLIDHQRLELGLHLHSDATVDRDNLQKKCQELFAHEKLAALVNALPASFLLRLGDEDGIPAPDVTEADLADRVSRLTSAHSWLSLTRTLPRDQVCQAAGEVVELCREGLVQLLPLMHFASWSRGNDSVLMKKTLKEKAVQRRSRGLQLKDRVRVVQGIFSGKQGLVEEIDDRGTLKVRLGTMSIQMESEDVVKL